MLVSLADFIQKLICVPNRGGVFFITLLFAHKPLKPVAFCKNYLLGNSKNRSSTASVEFFLQNSQNSQEKTCTRVSFLIKLHALACNFIKKQTLAQVFSCEFCKIF